MAELRRREGDARVELPTWTNNRLMTCKYGEANQAAVLTGHEKRPRAPFVPARARAREREREGEGKGIRYSLDVFARPTCAHASRAYIFNGCTLIALCLPIPHSTLHLHVHLHSLHPFRTAILLC